MKFYLNQSIILTVILAFGGFAQAQKAPNAKKQKAFNEAVAAAMPSIKPLVAPQKVRKILVLSKAGGYYHSSIETGKTCFKLMGEGTGPSRRVSTIIQHSTPRKT